MDTKKGDALAFWNVYQTLCNSRKITKVVTKPLICRFCGKQDPEVTFKLIPHGLASK